MRAHDDGHEQHDVVVVGGGQAGLAASYHLSRLGVEHVVLDASRRVGAAWRERWDSLRLFTPAAIDGLPGAPFPAAPGAFPTKDQMADYLAAYAAREHAPVRLGARVEGLAAGSDGFMVHVGAQRLSAREVIVATGFLSAANVPTLARELDPAIEQLHSSAYRNPGSVRGGSVLLVGAGNSGVEIALELALAGRRTLLAGHSTFMPKLVQASSGRIFFAFARRALTLDTPLGRRMRSRMEGHGAPVIRVGPADLARAGVHRVGRVTGVRDGQPVLEGGPAVPVDAVVWCTGFRPTFEWIRLPILDARGMPRHVSGAAVGVPGLSFLGLPFQSGFMSALVGGVGPDAQRLVSGVAARLRGREVIGANERPVTTAA